MSNNAKMLWNIQKTPPKHVKRLLNFLFLNTVLGSNIRFSAQMSNNAKKKTWNNQKTPTKHALMLFKNFLKIWLSAQKSGSRLRCRTMQKNTLKHPENTNKTCFEAFWEILENPVLVLKIRFLAEKSGSRLRCRIMLKIPWNTQKTPPKRVLILNNLLAIVRCVGQPTLFTILQMICTDQNWGSC